MAIIQMYLKPRPVSAVYGHSDYLLFGRLFNCEYGPFFAGYGPIPSDATQVYTFRSSALAASLSTFFNELIPSLEANVPDPHRFVRSAWPALHQLAVAQVDSWTDFRIKCENHLVQLTQGDHPPAPPPRNMRAWDSSPEWYNAVYSVLLWDAVELHGDEYQDTYLELFVWVYMYRAARQRTRIWRSLRQEMNMLVAAPAPAPLHSSWQWHHCFGFFPSYSGLLNLISSKALVAASALASIFTIESNGALALSLSSSIESLVTDSTSSHPDNVSNGSSMSSSHAGVLIDTNVNSPQCLFRRRNPIMVSDSLDL
ncbi:uncharacterized protein ARMOST_07273 [Armillaria ostoyae]|uniref:Uncharacterized protein n=1 Tax=Armillaria ostoyae TaxID=47428 RepID=A0A284R5D4_ARMOS|nr:uncharacterized protein ARMOST_07273 [Armillaria ostoyae]